MESIQDDSMNSSSEEVDQPEQDNNSNNNDDVGTGRFYECVFCKRGFNTAQALGGHMNIHRKDRAKNRPSALINSHQREEIYAGPQIYRQISSYPPYYSSVAGHQEVARVDYRTYMPASTSAAAVRPSYIHRGGDFYDRSPQLFSTFGDDWPLSLSLQFGPPDEDDKEKKEDVESEEDELDLELRLGHNP